MATRTEHSAKLIKLILIKVKLSFTSPRLIIITFERYSQKKEHTPVMTKSEKFQLVENYIVENQNAHYRLAYSYVKNKESALDIIQESIMKALKSIDSLEQIQYLKTWFYRILINTSIDFIHKDKRMVVVEDEILDYHLSSNEMEVPDIDLYEAIDHLAPKQKTLIILRFFEDMKIEDIAITLGVNSNTIKTRLYAALKKLRSTMEEKVKA